jgi:hypothetical protein
MKVGLLGVHQYQLPFHLTGVLFYVRRYFFPVILAYLYYRTKNKNTATILLIIYSIITGLAGNSKAGCLLVLFPIAFIAYMSDKKKLFWIVVVISAISYYYIRLTRTFIGELNGDIDFDDLIVKGALKTNSLFSVYDFMLDSIGAFSERLFGLRSAVLTYQYTKLSFDDLVNFYTLRQSMGQLIPNAAEDLFGVILSEDRAYGVSYGYTGSIIALANRNYYYIVIQAFIIGSILKIQGAFMNDIMNFDNRKAKYICIFAVCYGLLCLNDGYLLSHFYLVTVVLYFLKWICKHRYIIH